MTVKPSDAPRTETTRLSMTRQDTLPAAVVSLEHLPLDRESSRIQEMFGRVAPRYDLLNHLLSGSLDRLWRRRLARSMALPAGARVLDVCSGTGDQATALRRRGYRVAAVDFCLPMLAISRSKLEGAGFCGPVQGDALRLPVADGAFDGASVSFGLRNVTELDGALCELARVLRPGGELRVLEFGVPVAQPMRTLYLFYFKRLLPRVGSWISGDPAAYSYLPHSVLGFPQRQELVDRLLAAGFATGGFRSLSGGILCLYRARKG